MVDRKKELHMTFATSKARKWQGIVATCQKWQREQTLVQGTSQAQQTIGAATLSITARATSTRST